MSTINVRDRRDGWQRPKTEKEPNRCRATTTEDQFRTHRVIRCQKALDHEGQHFAAVGGSQAWRQYAWPNIPYEEPERAGGLERHPKSPLDELRDKIRKMEYWEEIGSVRVPILEALEELSDRRRGI